MPSLSEADRRAALQLARQAVAEAVSHRKFSDVIPPQEFFAERRGVFVTLHVRQRLQGCIGVVEAKEPLGEAIIRCAASAAMEDPRFAPMKPDQLGELNIEISLLSPVEPIVPGTPSRLGVTDCWSFCARTVACCSRRLPLNIV